MAKRYSSSENHKRDHFNDEIKSEKDRLPRGMYQAASGNLLGDYSSGLAARDRMERQHAGMIEEDHRAIANLPQEVMIKAYPMTGPYLPEVLNDTIAGVDGQIDYDDSQRRSHFYPKKV